MCNLQNYKKNCNFFLEYTIFKDDLIEFRCLCCNKSYQGKLNMEDITDAGYAQTKKIAKILK